jgi:hypothetical protein
VVSNTISYNVLSLRSLGGKAIGAADYLTPVRAVVLSNLQEKRGGDREGSSPSHSMRAFSLLVCFASWLLLSPFELQPIHALLSSRPLHLLRRNGRNKLSSTTQKLRMLGRAEAVRVIVIGRGNDIFEIETSYVSSRTGTRGSFTTSRTWEELEALDSVLLSSFGRRVVPNLPPRASHAKYIDAYLNSLLADGM